MINKKVKLCLSVPVVYPVTASYVSAVIVIMGISAHTFTLGYGIAILGLTMILIILAVMLREVFTVHVLVNNQHDDLVARVDQLILAMMAANIEIPEDPNDPKIKLVKGTKA